MTVTITITPPLPPVKVVHHSNKTKVTELPGEEVAYEYGIEGISGSTYTVCVLNPIIDKVSFVYGENSSEEIKGLTSTLMSMVKSGTEFPYLSQPSKYIFPSKQSYKFNLKLSLPNEDHCIFIQAIPGNKNTKSSLRIEYNPSKASEPLMSTFREFMDELLAEGMDGFLKGATVTRLDIAVDILNASMRDLLIRTPDKKKSHAYYGLEGNIETAYLNLQKKGKKYSSGEFTGYNKREQMKEMRERVYNGLPCTRIEAHLHCNKSIESLPSIKNPFIGIQATNTHILRTPEEAYHWQFFIDSCQQRGMENALSLIPAPLQKKYVDALEAQHTLSWRPHEIWKGYHDALRKMRKALKLSSVLFLPKNT